MVVDKERLASPKRNHLRVDIMFLPKKLGCNDVVKVPVPPLAVENDEGITRDGSSSDVMAQEHIATTLYLDSRCGEDGFLADVLFSERVSALLWCLTDSLCASMQQ